MCVRHRFIFENVPPITANRTRRDRRNPSKFTFSTGGVFFFLPKTLRSPRHYYYYRRRRLVDDGRRRFDERRRQVAWPERETTLRRRPRHIYKYV